MILSHHRLEALRPVDFARLHPIECAAAIAAAAAIAVRFSLEAARLVVMREVGIGLGHVFVSGKVGGSGSK